MKMTIDFGNHFLICYLLLEYFYEGEVNSNED
ncbi:MAG: hypothetical protein ACI96M_002945 [Candidatus Azotimanducaceae bacterium]|jgi:hypothetical protein